MKELGSAAFSTQLAFDRVTKRYGNAIAVECLSFSIEKPQIVTLLGPSGCGKTTTLRLIAGLESCDSGSIYMRGARIDHVPPYKRNVSTVFQDYALFPHLNVFGNVAFGFKVRGVHSDKYLPIVRNALERLRLSDLVDRRPHQLSGGQQQRVALARTLVLNPAILLLDEPLGALDQNLREDMQIELKRVQREVGITFIYVTHDQREAFTMSDRVILLSKGRIEQDGTPEALYQRPRSLFVARFTGIRNAIAGVVETVSGGQMTIPLRCGLKVGAVAPDNMVFAPGESVLVGIRPELVIFGPSSGPDNPALTLTVRSIVYAGRSYSIVGLLNTGEEFVLELPAAASSAAGIDEGDEISIHWRRSDTLVFKPEPE
jgi:ABC-type Fe3+/spermidine/putrescine transport system ATPase subunit